MNSMLLLCAVLGASGNWEEAAKRDGVTVYTRKAEGQNVAEVKAEGMIDAPPLAVWAVVRDYANYSKSMPYTQESKVLSTENDGKVIFFYSVVNAPLVAKRDYLIRILDESNWNEGKGFLKAAWTAAADKVPEKDGLVRVKLNNGYWLLEPRDNGARTWATYYVLTDPGGSIPKWIANQANNNAVPDVFLSVRKGVAKAK